MNEYKITPKEYFFKVDHNTIIAVLLPLDDNGISKSTMQNITIAIIDKLTFDEILHKITGYEEKDFNKFKKDFRNGKQKK